ncbi:calcium-binding protein [Streptomyces sp. NBC_01077]|uniref:calcium-binding protein n=1 Tax=Streptomyces sp. NBC_01077 TaxID=2903746 RepID=UPI00386F9FEB|nr:calcium-binding protein [Streptomyces sp. NBC_01077]
MRALTRTGFAVALVGAAFATTAVVPAAQAATGNLRIAKVVVNGGKDIVLTTAAKKVTVTATLSEDSALTEVWLDLENRVGDQVSFYASRRATCTGSGTVKTCTTALTLDPRSDLIHNALAGPNNWKVWVQADSRDGDFASGSYPSVGVRRATALSGDAGPEPVRKGVTLTVTGRLTAANWNSNSWTGLSGKAVELQYCKASCSAYTTVKTVTSNSTGNLRTTVKAAADGYWRWRYVAPHWAASSLSAADYVDVR